MKKINIVLPTKNRQDILLDSVTSIVNQNFEDFTVKLIIVDQSKVSLDPKLFNVFDNKKIEIIYIYEPYKIDSLVSARRYAIAYINENNLHSDFIGFVEDDTYASENYLNNMIRAFNKHPNVIGANGYVYQEAGKGMLYNFAHRFFHIGIFKDNRSYFYNKKTESKINNISGGICLWKSEIFNDVNFRENSKFHMLEDMDFSMIVKEAFPNKDFLFVPGAKIDHFARINTKKDLIDIHRRHAHELELFYNIHKKSILSLISYYLVRCWVLLKKIRYT